MSFERKKAETHAVRCASVLKASYMMPFAQLHDPLVQLVAVLIQGKMQVNQRIEAAQGPQVRIGRRHQLKAPSHLVPNRHRQSRSWRKVFVGPTPRRADAIRATSVRWSIFRYLLDPDPVLDEETAKMLNALVAENIKKTSVQTE